MQFEFATATRIIFGAGKLAEVGSVARAFGTRALVVTGGDTKRADSLLNLLRTHGMEPSSFSVGGEPTLAMVEAGIAFAKKQNPDCAIGFGGGSALDAAKAIAIMVANGGALLDYLEVIGGGRPLSKPSLPCLAIPTTAGTGAEVTRNAVIGSPEHRAKASLRSPHMLPRVALVDPELTLGLPPCITAASGMDALTQLIEPFVSSRANPLTDALCREGIPRAARSLRLAVENGSSQSAREDMALASLFSGLALSNSGLGAVHGFAGPIGGMFSAPHGAVCAALLPHVMEANLRALRHRQPKSDTERRFAEVARLLTSNQEATADNGVQWVRQLVQSLGIPGLKTYNVAERDLDGLVLKSQKASSMKGNPIELTSEELREILLRAL